MKTITEFNKQNIKDVRDAVAEAIAVLAKVGIDAKIGNINYDAYEVRTKMTLQIKRDTTAPIKNASVAAMSDLDKMTNRDIMIDNRNRAVMHKDGLIGGKTAAELTAEEQLTPAYKNF